ncbi:MAG TPA: NAD(P)/FAD-dependent oxidoreductase [Candidatus Obscuribacterales bacterium]
MSGESIKEKCRLASYDAIVIGSGPNGVAAAIVLAAEGLSVLIVEAKQTAGGGCRSMELTLPGFVHDVCSAIHPLGIGSPFFRTLPLDKYGLRWIHPQAPIAHPFADGHALLVERSVEATASRLGADERAYLKLVGELLPDWDELCRLLLSPLKLMAYPLQAMKFGLRAVQPAGMLAHNYFSTPGARGLFAGIAAHSGLRLEDPASASFGLVLALSAHAVGWPMPAGGSQKLSDALLAHFTALGGEIILGCRVTSLDELPKSRLILCDVTPRQLLAMGKHLLPEGYKRKMERFRHGVACFKLDYALAGPVPWKSPLVERAATIHIGGTLEEIAKSERQAWSGEPPEKPYVLAVQTTLFDPTRAPPGKHTLWAYCHLPNACQFDMSERIEAQIESVAPGFRKLILARHALSPSALEDYNANYVGGDISGGAVTLGQLFTRPVVKPIPYATPVPGLYLCSASTPPGSGVHGMSGYYAAHCALRNWR